MPCCSLHLGIAHGSHALLQTPCFLQYLFTAWLHSQKMHAVTLCDKTHWKVNFFLLSRSSFFLPAMAYGEKKTHSAFMWVMQKVNPEKEAGGNWYACYYKTETNVRQTTRLKQHIRGAQDLLQGTDMKEILMASPKKPKTNQPTKKTHKKTPNLTWSISWPEQYGKTNLVLCPGDKRLCSDDLREEKSKFEVFQRNSTFWSTAWAHPGHQQNQIAHWACELLAVHLEYHEQDKAVSGTSPWKLHVCIHSLSQ